MNSVVRRASSNTTLSSISPGQVYKDRDISSASHTPPKRTKFAKLFTSSLSKHASSNSKLSVIGPSSSSSSSIISNASKPVLINSNKHNSEISNSFNNTNGISTPVSMVTNRRKNISIQNDQNHRTPPPQINIKPDRRKDIKLTNCQEKDGIWTATGQFGRESRHSKRAEISYDKKKFKFIQRDDQGNKHVFEIQAADIEGKILHNQTNNILRYYLRIEINR